MKLSKAMTHKHGIIWNIQSCTGWVYLYNKGCFRNSIDKWIISVSFTGGSFPKDRQNIPFNTKKEALDYVKSLEKEKIPLLEIIDWEVIK